MPFSQSQQISAIVGYAESLQPMSVLDVGAGMGQYGFLLRTNLEHLNLFDVQGDQGVLRPRSGWQRRIDGIEGFAAYLTPVHDYAYNRVLIGDALELLLTLPDNSYELVMAIDILEHFEKPAGQRFLRECFRVSSRACLISTPKDFIPQAVAANPLEDHRSHWTLDELQGQGSARVIDDSVSWIVVSAK
jgi:ubiquinone/menaquinone biosynthesis C-methylase UbiE